VHHFPSAFLSHYCSLLADPDPGLQEQAFHIVRHLAETEDDIDVIFQEFGSENLLNYLAPALETDNVDILLQVHFRFMNSCNQR
jgi:armadillo repeat-containing protein 8